MITKEDGNRRIYLVVPGPELAGRMIADLQDRGVAHERIALYAYQPERLANLPVVTTSLNAGPRRIVIRALIFAAVAALVGLALLAEGVHWLVLPLLVLAGVNLGAGSVYKTPLPDDAEPLRAELRRNDILMLVDVDDSDQGPIQKGIAEQFPEIRVKGTDPTGTPPFP